MLFVNRETGFRAEIDFRLFCKGDGEALRQCVADFYGDGYPYKEYLDESFLLEKISAGDMTVLCGVTREGEIISTSALCRSREFWGSALLMLRVVKNAYRDMGMRRMEKELAEQRIDIMLTQIQPHFLYNTLGTIAYLCGNDPEKAERVTREFSLFLRGNIDSLKNRGLIPFEKELEHVKNYLYLEQQRFQDRLTVIYDIRTTDFFVPPLTLQPIVENAVRHGILQKRNGGTVTLHNEL